MAIKPFMLCTLLVTFSPFTFATPNEWQTNNRSVSITAGLVKQDYEEYDTQGLTSNGILNTEKSNIHQIALNARYQFAPKGIWLQGRAVAVTGATNYDGYVQTGSQLTPFSTVTDNAMYDLSANVGYAIPIGEKFQIIPNVSGQSYRWERDLVQYDEQFDQKSALVGVVAQYQVTPKLGLELSADIGKNMASKIRVPEYDFEQDLAEKPVWQVDGKASYQLTDNLAVIGEVSHRELQYGESATQNNLSYPSGKAKQTSGLVGVRTSF